MLFYVGFLIAGFIRFWMLISPYKDVISNRVELATPLNSWKRLMEGVFLYNKGINPYQGDMFHESPIVLVAFHKLTTTFTWQYFLPLLFTLSDLLTAYFLYLTAKNFMSLLKKEQDANLENFAKDSKPLLLKKHDFETPPIYVLAAYLFNPYSVLNCVAMTSTVFGNVFISFALVSMTSGWRIPCCIAIAAASHHALYPALLIVPALILIQNLTEGCAICSYIKTLTVFVLSWGFLIYFSAYLMDGSYQFLENTYGFILTVPDLKPNIGLFWYFFTEMFEHFRQLFIFSFQINALLIYVLPLTIRFHRQPVLLATTLATLAATFKSYPCLGDVALYLALIPMWKHTFSYMRQKFIVGCFLAVTLALGPSVWHLWIYARSANANFFFGVTLAFATAQIFLMTDVLFAYMQREYAMRYGSSREIDGKPAKLVLIS